KDIDTRFDYKYHEEDYYIYRAFAHIDEKPEFVIMAIYKKSEMEDLNENIYESLPDYYFWIVLGNIVTLILLLLVQTLKIMRSYVKMMNQYRKVD
ncbi:MAG: hypothetical protein V2I33_24590, partial [Kangiellaceae bacterium]|nr:hypothetical protein [Kangiellaceae bacterium]